MKALSAMLLAVGLLMPAQANADEMRTSLYMSNACRAMDSAGAEFNAYDAGVCLGGISGFVQAQRTFQLLGLDTYCAPQSSTYEQARRVWLNYLERHPEKLHLDGIATFFASMREAFPCTDGQ